ncbi:hypothetical protein BASA83_010445 [Batrachochytrium salamandrivorans]|nr:hypothetical protein BASA83_010445 [Batrachochytrium salamandrivorans]
MQFGVAKYSIISFTGHLAPRLDNPLDIQLHGQLVSRVESYKYLVVMGKAYYGLELVGGNKSHLAPLQTTINKGIRLFTGARLSTAIGPLLAETGIGSLLTRSLVSRVRLLERSMTKRTPINAICSSTDNDVFTLNVQGRLVRSQRWFWSRRAKQLYRNRYWLTLQVRPKTVKQRHSFCSDGDSANRWRLCIAPKLTTCSYVQANHASSAKFLRSPALSTGQAIGASLLSLARCGGLWDYPRALKADTRFEPPISVAQQEIPRQAQDTVEENPTASRTTTTDTHTAAISSTPTPTQISYIGSDDILTVLLGGSLPGTNTAGNTEACPGQQWLTVDHCILCDQQLLSISIAHLVVECEQVTGHRIQSGLVPAIQKSRLRLLGRSTRSGCGECIYLAPRWSLKWQSRSGPIVGWTGTVEH